MPIKNTVTKMLLASVLSSVVNLIATLIVNIVITFRSAASQTVAAVFLAILSPIVFSIMLVYLLHVYRANGEGDVWDDYPEIYGGVAKDISKIIKRERYTLLLIISVSAANLLLWILNHALLHISILNAITLIFSTMFSLHSLFPYTILGQCLGYASGAVLTCIIYVITFALFRWKWRRFM